MFTNRFNFHLIFALILTATAAFNHTKTEHQTAIFADITHIEINNQCGNITVKTHNKNYVQLDQDTTYKKSNKKPKISNFVKKGTLIIDVKKSSSSGLPQWLSNIFTIFETKSNPQVDHVIMIPKKIQIDTKLNVGYGNINLINVNGSINTNTGSENIRINKAKSNVETNVGSGSIYINNVHGAITANAGKGTINITKARNSIQASTATGDIKIKQYLGKARVSLQTVFGSIQCPNELTKIRQLMGSSAQGIIENDQYLINASTSMGNIILN